MNNTITKGRIESFVDNIGNIVVCICTGECKSDRYEYYFKFNGEKFKADSCRTYGYGRTECIYDNISYKNVAYETKYLGEGIDYVKGFNNTLPILFVVLLAFLIYQIYKFYR